MSVDYVARAWNIAQVRIIAYDLKIRRGVTSSPPEERTTQ